MARGHQISQVPELPLVISNDAFNEPKKTKSAITLLKQVGVYADIQKAAKGRGFRSGLAHRRGRRYRNHRGPIIVYNGSPKSVAAYRNLPNTKLVSVSKLNMLDLAPGGHVGRFVVFSQSAFEKLDKYFGTYKVGGGSAHKFRPPRSILTNSDIYRVIKSREVMSISRPKIAQFKRSKRTNPIKNIKSMLRLNPFWKQMDRRIKGYKKRVKRENIKSKLEKSAELRFAQRKKELFAKLPLPKFEPTRANKEQRLKVREHRKAELQKVSKLWTDQDKEEVHKRKEASKQHQEEVAKRPVKFLTEEEIKKTKIEKRKSQYKKAKVNRQNRRKDEAEKKQKDEENAKKRLAGIEKAKKHAAERVAAVKKIAEHRKTPEYKKEREARLAKRREVIAKRKAEGKVPEETEFITLSREQRIKNGEARMKRTWGHRKGEPTPKKQKKEGEAEETKEEKKKKGKKPEAPVAKKAPAKAAAKKPADAKKGAAKKPAEAKAKDAGKKK